MAHWTAPIQLHCLFEVSVVCVQRQDQLLVTCEVAKTALEGAVSTDAQTTQVCGSVAISTISTNAQDFLVRGSMAGMLEVRWQLLGEVEHQAAQVALWQEQSVL